MGFCHRGSKEPTCLKVNLPCGLRCGPSRSLFLEWLSSKNSFCPQGFGSGAPCTLVGGHLAIRLRDPDSRVQPEGCNGQLPDHFLVWWAWPIVCGDGGVNRSFELRWHLRIAAISSGKRFSLTVPLSLCTGVSYHQCDSGCYPTCYHFVRAPYEL